MKKIMYMLIVLFMLSPMAAWAEEFLKAPLPEGGTVISQTDKQLVKSYAMPYDDVIAFYKEQFTKKDVKFKHRAGGTYMVEYSNLPWHSVLVEKAPEGTKVTVTKDSWIWILSTLTLRFFAVFLVLVCLFIPLTVIGSLVKRAQEKAKMAAAKA